MDRLIFTVKEEFEDNTAEIAGRWKKIGIDVVRVYPSGIIIVAKPEAKLLNKILIEGKVNPRFKKETAVRIAPPNALIQ
jgi:hypothetical protein